MLENMIQPSKKRNEENKTRTPNKATGVGMLFFLKPRIIGLKIIEKRMAITNGIKTVLSCARATPSTKTAITPRKTFNRVLLLLPRTIQIICA